MSRFVLSINYYPTNNSKNNYIKDFIVEPSHKEKAQVKIENNSIFLYTYLNHEPLKRERFFSNEFWAVLLIGEIIDFKVIPFQKIINIVENKKYDEFKSFNGVFAIIVYDKVEEEYYVISDYRGQYPIYYGSQKDVFIVTSELSACCRIFENAVFNEGWLYDYMYFHYPVDRETFLKNVSRLLHSSVMEYSNKTKEIKITKYADVFRKKKKLLYGDDGLKYAKEIFGKRVPLYFEDSENVACSLTGGWDGRTNIALAPNKNLITAYTYGGKNCSDLIYSRYAAKAVGSKHLKILFDEKIIPELPSLIMDTVYLTSGLQSIQRATLLKVYSLLSDFSVVISGMQYDSLFRGHIGGPSTISENVRGIFKNGTNNINLDSFKEMFQIDHNVFSDHINYKIKKLEEAFGNLQTLEAQMLFNIYLKFPNYFAGEFKISERFVTLRVPAWDIDLIDLAFAVEHSTISYSEYIDNKRDSRRSMILQSYIISQFAPELVNIPLQSMITPKAVLKGDLNLTLYRYYRRVINKFNNMIFYRDQKPLEDWENWLNIDHKKFVDDLIFSKDSLINNYFKESYLNKIKDSRNHRIVGKLCTTEIILRLIKNKWQRFW